MIEIKILIDENKLLNSTFDDNNMELDSDIRRLLSDIIQNYKKGSNDNSYNYYTSKLFEFTINKK